MFLSIFGYLNIMQFGSMHKILFKIPNWHTFLYLKLGALGLWTIIHSQDPHLTKFVGPTAHFFPMYPFCQSQTYSCSYFGSLASLFVYRPTAKEFFHQSMSACKQQLEFASLLLAVICILIKYKNRTFCTASSTTVLFHILHSCLFVHVCQFCGLVCCD